jgi:hypothetical protein
LTDGTQTECSGGTTWQEADNVNKNAILAQSRRPVSYPEMTVGCALTATQGG